MNQQMTLTKSKIVNITSNNATKNNSSMNSNVSIPLPSLVSKVDEKIVNIFFKVIHGEIPNSFYLVNSANNTLIINSTTYTISSGNYNANSLLSSMQNLLPTGYTIAYNSNTLKYTFSYTSSFTISKSSTILRIIGGNTSADMVSSSNTFIMPYVVNFLPVPRINFKCSQLSFNNYNQGDKSSDMFLSIQNNSGLANMILYNNMTDLKYVFDNDNLTRLDIRVTDDFNNLIDFNGVDWYICFQLDIEYISNIKQGTFTDILNNNNSTLVGN
jgi:hypothetical protein